MINLASVNFGHIRILFRVIFFGCIQFCAHGTYPSFRSVINTILVKWPTTWSTNCADRNSFMAMPAIFVVFILEFVWSEGEQPEEKIKYKIHLNCWIDFLECSIHTLWKIYSTYCIRKLTKIFVIIHFAFSLIWNVKMFYM